MPHEKVLTEYGEIKIEDLFKIGKEIVEKDELKEIRKLNIKVHTLNENGEIKIINAPYVWKLKHKGKMIKVKLKNWHSITTTPEHPFLTNNGWIKAENIKKECMLQYQEKFMVMRILRSSLNLLIQRY